MAAKYQKRFAISRTELKLIETALREQAKSLSEKILDQQSTSASEETDHTKQLSSHMNEIHSLLGNLHNQKVWYRPQDTIPFG